MPLRSALKGLARCLLAIATLGAVAACGGAISPPGQSLQTSPPAPAQPTPVGLELPAAGKIYLGAYAFATRSANDLTTLEQNIGRKVAMDMHYYEWTSNFPLTPELSDVVTTRLPIDSWDCGLTNAQIAAGAGDLLITTRALAIKNFGHPVFLRYFWDMNLPSTFQSRGLCYDPSTDNPDTTFSPTNFVLAWQHIRAIFAQEKVTNVIWVWNMAAGGINPAPYYPGDAYVDWIGIDAYDTTGGGFAAAIAPAYNIAAGFHKPILIGETGSIAANQQAFFAGAVPALKTDFPLVGGVVYYDANSQLNAEYALDWRLSQAVGQPAFKAFATDPYLSAYGSL